MGSMFRLTYDVTLKDPDKEKELIDKLRCRNGNLEINSVREGGGDMEETNLYELKALGPDTLCYKTIGKARDEEETFEYNRFKEKAKVDLRGLELEDTQDEFNKI